MILVEFASRSFARYVASPPAVSEAAFSARIVKDHTPHSTHAADGADTHSDDVDAGRVLVVDRHRRHFGLRLKRFVLLARVELRLTLRGALADFLAGFALMLLLLLRVAFGHVGPLCEELKCEQTYRGESATSTAVPTGSARTETKSAGASHQTSGPKTPPSSVEPTG